MLTQRLKRRHGTRGEGYGRTVSLCATVGVAETVTVFSKADLPAAMQYHRIGQ